ncbi:tonB-system energizer ExbB [Acinetobacter sp. EC24]|nr:tonB-system energizer ExbB [Acinetobacter rathckeae]MBF7696540.1 tonB-system energizer ExbB [Acinetobacter rathckeae]
MFLHADWVVQSTMILLIIASIATWTILIAKSLELRKINAHLYQSYKVLGSIKILKDISISLDVKNSVIQDFLDEIDTEFEQSKGLAKYSGMKERIAVRLENVELLYSRHLKKGIGLLATIGAVSPFIGLFGTVWGIMNSFIGITQSNTTSLAVVAPGIAEALLATAFGLMAAIPAVIIYNYFTRVLNTMNENLGCVSLLTQQIVSRDLDYYEELQNVERTESSL